MQISSSLLLQANSNRLLVLYTMYIIFSTFDVGNVLLLLDATHGNVRISSRVGKYPDIVRVIFSALGFRECLYRDGGVDRAITVDVLVRRRIFHVALCPFPAAIYQTSCQAHGVEGKEAYYGDDDGSCPVQLRVGRLEFVNIRRRYAMINCAKYVEKEEKEETNHFFGYPGRGYGPVVMRMLAGGQPHCVRLIVESFRCENT